MALVVIETDELRTLISDAVHNAVIQKNDTRLDSVESVKTKKDACKFLNISMPTLNALIYKGEIQSYNVGGRIVFKQSELLKALQPIRAKN